MTRNEGFRIREWGGPLGWEEWDLADPGPGEILVDVEACGVGQTVLNYVRGDNWSDPQLLPRVPGHEVVARIAAVGEGVSAHAVGDRVLAYFYLSCFACRACQAGDEARCERPAGRYGVHRDGGYARRSILPQGNAVAFPYDLDAAQATVVPDATATSVHVCDSRLRLAKGDRVCVIGAGGGVGAHLVQVALVRGAEVAGLDVAPSKLELIASLGAAPVDSTSFEAVDLGPWDGRADAVVDLVGTRASTTWALDHVGQGGRVCVLSAVPGVEVTVAPRDLVLREAALLGSHYASRRELAEAARLVAAGDVRPVLGAIEPARDVESLHERLRDGSLLGRGAIVWDDGRTA